MTPAEEKFQHQVRACLHALSSELDPVLVKLVEHTYPPEVVAIAFEVFSDGFTQVFPVRCFFMDENNCEFFVYEGGKATYPSPVDPDLLSIENVYPDTLEAELEADSPESDPWHIATEELCDWFLARWRAARGATFRLAATIAHHGSGTELNLMTGLVQPRGALYK